MEYAGAVPPRQILAAVVRADRLLHKSSDGSLERWLEHCEEITRRLSATWRPPDQRVVTATRGTVRPH
jgi:hypothetical protein